jgi:hypothetical protein
MTYKKTATYTVDPKKLEEAYSKIKTLLLSMFGTDCEGDPNVEFILIDRQRHSRMLQRPVPYDFRNPDGSEPENRAKRISNLEAAMEFAKFNVDVSNRCFDILFGVWQEYKREDAVKSTEKK